MKKFALLVSLASVLFSSPAISGGKNTCQDALYDGGRLTSAEEYCNSPAIYAQRELLTRIALIACSGSPPNDTFYFWTGRGIEHFNASMRRNGIVKACDTLKAEIRPWMQFRR